MRRGDILTLAVKGESGGKPRPAVVVQADPFEAHSTIIVCPFTTNPVEAAAFRVVIEPSSFNALAERSALMVDRLLCVSRDKIGPSVGRLRPDELKRLDRALLIVLGLAG